MKTWIQKHLRRLAAFAALMSCGCDNLFPTNGQTPTPQPPAVTEHVVKIMVDGTGKISVGGTAKIDVAAPKQPTVCPCCGMTGGCQGLCGKAGCTCPRGVPSAAVSAGSPVAPLPQFSTRYEQRQICENGVCRIVSVPVSTPLASGGQITIYDTGSPAGRAMRAAIGSRGVEWKHSSPPVAINGARWSPTAIKPDGSAWTPGASGWHAGSEAQFREWAAR